MLSRRSITLLLIGLVVSQFLVVNVSGEPFESQNDDHYDSSPNFVPVKDRIKGINSRTKNNDFVPPSNWPYVKEIVEALEPISQPDRNDLIPTPVSVKDRAKKIASHTKDSDWVPPSNSPSLAERAKNSGWVDCFPGGRCT
ncbi:uncharacterized protein LOC129568910 [Sitodiplosis mosellana]|uniref:uncharacterized protein LOC129568910 n=1 Tax=Sitodiplosis mosellana TaxID=263140 RepID=UPI002444C6D2|nr:uncharacterized protein LOC129568910 [Sitodiplosis mosellana]